MVWGAFPVAARVLLSVLLARLFGTSDPSPNREAFLANFPVVGGGLCYLPGFTPSCLDRLLCQGFRRPGVSRFSARSAVPLILPISVWALKL